MYWLAYNTPIYCLLFEMPVLLVVLHLHAKQIHGYRVRQHALQVTDPLTGFAAKHLLVHLAQRAWQISKASGDDVAIAYLQPVTLGGRNQGADMVPRIVRILRTVARPQDTVIAVSATQFALLMPGRTRDEALMGQLSRIVALSLMQDDEHSGQPALRFNIVAATRRSFAGNWQELHAVLLAKLVDRASWGHRAIRFAQQSGDGTDLDSQAFSDYWQDVVNRVAAEEENGERPTTLTLS
jgi:GGDEF domain-containing protein